MRIGNHSPGGVIDDKASAVKVVNLLKAGLQLGRGVVGQAGFILAQERGDNG